MLVVDKVRRQCKSRELKKRFKQLDANSPRIKTQIDFNKNQAEIFKNNNKNSSFLIFDKKSSDASQSSSEPQNHQQSQFANFKLLYDQDINEVGSNYSYCSDIKKKGKLVPTKWDKFRKDTSRIRLKIKTKRPVESKPAVQFMASITDQSVQNLQPVQRQYINKSPSFYAFQRLTPLQEEHAKLKDDKISKLSVKYRKQVPPLPFKQKVQFSSQQLKSVKETNQLNNQINKTWESLSTNLHSFRECHLKVDQIARENHLVRTCEGTRQKRGEMKKQRNSCEPIMKLENALNDKIENQHKVVEENLQFNKTNHFDLFQPNIPHTL